MKIVPCTITAAKLFVLGHHRHHRPPVSGLFALGLEHEGAVIGVAIVGRPVARALQDGSTAEVTRLCTLGHPNAASRLLSACWRACRALGYTRLITYTRADEPGTSLRAAGWTRGCPRSRSTMVLSVTPAFFNHGGRQTPLGGSSPGIT